MLITIEKDSLNCLASNLLRTSFFFAPFNGQHSNSSGSCTMNSMKTLGGERGFVLVGDSFFFKWMLTSQPKGNMIKTH